MATGNRDTNKMEDLMTSEKTRDLACLIFNELDDTSFVQAKMSGRIINRVANAESMPLFWYHYFKYLTKTSVSELRTIFKYIPDTDVKEFDEFVTSHFVSSEVDSKFHDDPKHDISFYAAMKGQVAITKNIRKTEKGICIQENGCGYTQLHYAAQNGHSKVYELMALKLYDKNPPSSVDGLTPFDLAKSNNHKVMCDLITDLIVGKYKPFEGRKLIHVIAMFGNFNDYEIISMKERATNIKTTCGYELTQLHFAANNGHVKICEFILERIKKKSDQNPRDYLGRTPLHLAAEKGHLEVCEMIVKKLVDSKNHVQSNLEVPLHVAAKKG